MADPNRLYANDAKAMACARNLDETLRASQKLEDLLKMYYKEDYISKKSADTEKILPIMQPWKNKRNGK